MATLGQAKSQSPLSRIREIVNESKNGEALRNSLLRGSSSKKTSFERDLGITDFGMCDITLVLDNMEDHAKDLIPPIDEWVIGTSAEQLIYMSPCNGLPLTREVSVY